jgi:hypothetical protein
MSWESSFIFQTLKNKKTIIILLIPIKYVICETWPGEPQFDNVEIRGYLVVFNVLVIFLLLNKAY